jgi:hypothetical protein
MSTTEVLLVSGGGRFTDPWHPFAETSAALAAALGARGCAVELSDDADTGLTRLATDALPDLLVLNLGWHGPDQFAEPATEALVDALRRGLPTMLAHSTLTAFPEWPLWREIAGGGWTPDVSYHPDYGPATLEPRSEHPLGAGLSALSVVDERYTDLWLDDGSAVFLEHEEAGARHPLAWTRTWGASPVLADALGHDAQSYRSPDRQLLLERELDWLLGSSSSTPS